MICYEYNKRFSHSLSLILPPTYNILYLSNSFLDNWLSINSIYTVKFFFNKGNLFYILIKLTSKIKKLVSIFHDGILTISISSIENVRGSISILLKEKYKIKIPFSFTNYLLYNAIEIFIEPIFK